MDLRIALSPVVLSCRNMRRTLRPPRGGACYKRRNDDCGSSFRNRDKEPLYCLFQRFNRFS
jgi:hypothetical protein